MPIPARKFMSWSTIDGSVLGAYVKYDSCNCQIPLVDSGPLWKVESVVQIRL